MKHSHLPITLPRHQIVSLNMHIRPLAKQTGVGSKGLEKSCKIQYWAPPPALCELLFHGSGCITCGGFINHSHAAFQ
jgi:hypothetical protein